MSRGTFVFLLLMAFGSVTWAETAVFGPIDTDSIWTVDGSPYVISGDVEVVGGATLTIEAGVLVQGRAGARLVVGGEDAGDTGALVALGRPGQCIRFDARVRDEPWGGILFRETTIEPQFGPDGEYVSGSILSFCRVERCEEPIAMQGAVAYLASTTVIGPSLPFGAGVRVELRDAQTLKTLRADGLEVRDSRGFGVYIDGGTGHQIADSAFNGNTQGAYILSPSRDDDRMTIRLERCEFVGNGTSGTTPSNGGGLLLVTFGDAELLECVFLANQADSNGGAIWGYAETLVLQGCEFDRNQAGHIGGAIEIESDSMTIDDCVFVENVAVGAGGAVFCLGSGRQELFVNSSRFTGNESPYGGAMLVRDLSPRIEQSEFTSNASTIDGGAIRFLSCNRVALDSNRFLDNSTGGSGGAISFDGIQARDGVDIVGNTFAGNIARLGGAVYTTDASGDDTVFSFAERGGLVNTFASNTAELGDDIYHAGPADIDATGVCWGTTVPVAIAARISAGTDEPGLGIVRFDPVAADCDVCRTDLDGDGALTVFDFLAFSGLFGLGDPQADFDGDGRFTLFDFLAFQAEFDAGCP